ncbi:helix-turn-helix domain-containing protein [Rhizocola hellebori]|uniref:helix-turn-helix domain-containing protein n=1 Tax=Rhizocola hellebori TaxID=1392758 RepID=UPI001EF26E33|nr:XRE family transcriptional regulator [Rhizocola hellebori]
MAEGEGLLSGGLSMAELGLRVRARRHAQGLGLEQVAKLSGVSRSMVSDVERGAKTPTVLVLDRLATALGTSIARLLDEPAGDALVLLRNNQQRVVSDPAGWERRILSPVLPGVEFEFMRTVLGPRVDAGEFSPHQSGSREYVAVESGRLTLTVDGQVCVLEAGDSVYFPGDCRHSFANGQAAECVYYLVMDLGTVGPHRDRVTGSVDG